MINLLAIVRSRNIRWAALVFQALWLNVVVPGHTRGMVRVPGDACPNCSSVAFHSAGGCHDSHKAPAGDPATHCALCSFAAALSVPPTLDLTPPALGFLEITPVAVAERVGSASLPTPYDGRAPPALTSARV